MEQLKSKSYTLRDESDIWLGQIVLTSDGFFGSLTDWGNLSFAWRHTGKEDFREFLCGLNTQYFRGKMYQGNTYFIRKNMKNLVMFLLKKYYQHYKML